MALRMTSKRKGEGREGKSVGRKRWREEGREGGREGR